MSGSKSAGEGDNGGLLVIQGLLPFWLTEAVFHNRCWCYQGTLPCRVITAPWKLIRSPTGKRLQHLNKGRTFSQGQRNRSLGFPVKFTRTFPISYKIHLFFKTFLFYKKWKKFKKNIQCLLCVFFLSAQKYEACIPVLTLLRLETDFRVTGLAAALTSNIKH